MLGLGNLNKDIKLNIYSECKNKQTYKKWLTPLNVMDSNKHTDEVAPSYTNYVFRLKNAKQRASVLEEE